MPSGWSVYREHKSWIAILIANLAFLAVAVWNSLPIFPILWIYWIHNLVMCFYTYRRLRIGLNVTHFENPKLNGFMYGCVGFLLFQLVFMYGFNSFNVSWTKSLNYGADHASNLHFGIFPTADLIYLSIFFVSTVWSYHANNQEQIKADKLKSPDVEKIVEATHLRMLPMFVGIFLVAAPVEDPSMQSLSLSFFVLAKTIGEIFKSCGFEERNIAA